jgi:hypothetical protein
MEDVVLLDIGMLYRVSFPLLAAPPRIELARYDRYAHCECCMFNDYMYPCMTTWRRAGAHESGRQRRCVV